jgi:hypothetical protein
MPKLGFRVTPGAGCGDKRGEKGHRRIWHPDAELPRQELLAGIAGALLWYGMAFAGADPACGN